MEQVKLLFSLLSLSFHYYYYCYYYYYYYCYYCYYYCYYYYYYYCYYYFTFLFSFSIFSLVFIPLVFVQTLYFYSFSGNNYMPLGIVIFCYYVFVIYNVIVKKAVFRIFSEAETAALHKLFHNKSLPFYSPCEKKNYNNRQYVDFFFL